MWIRGEHMNCNRTINDIDSREKNSNLTESSSNETAMWRRVDTHTHTHTLWGRTVTTILCVENKIF